MALPKPVNCVGQCLPDIEPALVDCAAIEAAFELLPILDFSDGVENSSAVVATNMYVYDDRSDLFRDPYQGWEPPAKHVRRCLGQADDDFEGAFNIRGGPYLSWGGGMGTQVGRLRDPSMIDLEPPDDIYNDYVVDMREWEGISFWARRGPDGQAGIRIGVFDKYTDDDLAFIAASNEQAPYCERIRECGCRSPERPCNPFTDDSGRVGHFCWNPEVDPPPEINPNDGSDQSEERYEACGEYMCDNPYPAYPGGPPDVWERNTSLPEHLRELGTGDPKFYGRACTTHALRGGIERQYCFTPGEDPPPAEVEQQCGDYWVKPVHVTPEWKFYTVPFTTMLQQGWAKESRLLDLTSISAVRFTWDRGWIDYWIDDVSFYRRKRE